MTLLPDQSAGTNADRSRSLNRQAVLGRIKTAGQMGRAAMARSLGLSTQAISNIIADLQQDGLLVECGMRSAGRGQPAMQYALNPTGGFAMGIEVRPDALFTAILDLNGTPVITRRRTLSSHAPGPVLALVAQLRDAMLDKAGIEPARLLGAGVVMPGPFGPTGLSGQGPDLADWNSMDTAGAFSEALDLPVELSNDANAAAMAERVGGVAQGLTHYAFLYFGAGLGLGLVNQGQLIAGAFGNAGEIGHLPVRTAAGTRRLEDVLSRMAVQARMNRGPLDVMALDALFTGRNPDLMAWLDDASAVLGQAVGVIENLFDPQSIILGGAMPEAVLENLVAQTQLPDLSVANRPDATFARLQCGTSGPMTATLGAGALILNRAFTPQTATL